MRPFLSPVRGVVSLLAVSTIVACSTPESTVRIGAPCIAPESARDLPRPDPAPIDTLVSLERRIEIDRPLSVVLESEAQTTLEEAVSSDSSMPHPTGTQVLTPGEFGQPGSRRLVCLSDGSTLVEEVLISQTDARAREFRYVVWNYTARQARPVSYAVGRFEFRAIDAGRTHVTWTYAFQLRRDRWPGRLGGLGDWLFRVGFLEGAYAKMMRTTLAGIKARAEAMPQA